MVASLPSHFVARKTPACVILLPAPETQSHTLARGETLATLGGKSIGLGIKISKRHLTKKERETGVRLLPDCGQTEASREKRRVETRTWGIWKDKKEGMD